MSEEVDISVFYSWQSDLADATNRRAIRSALRAASSKAEEKHNVKIVLDEATRGESGSPNIPATILRKIAACDIFVCDLTTINSAAPTEDRRVPNPNILFELGYAVSQLGWQRIVMLFNLEFGSFPQDLSFDIDRHRASPYRLSTADPKNESNISELRKTLKEAISAVIVSNPARPMEARNKSPEEIRRLRDIENLTWALSTVHIPSLDEMILDLPYYLKGCVFYFWESYRGIVSSSLFHIYDKTANALFLEILYNWGGCLSHGDQYHMATNPNLYVFSNPGGIPLLERQRQAWDEIDACRSKLRNSLDQLFEHVRTEYLEIDLDALSRNAWIKYVDFEKEQVALLEK